VSLTLAKNKTKGNKPRSEKRMRWVGKDSWGLRLSGRWTATMVSGAGKGTGCCDMSGAWRRSWHGRGYGERG